MDQWAGKLNKKWEGGMGRDVTPLTSVEMCKGGKVKISGRGDIFNLF